MLDKLMDSIGGDVISSITEKAGISADQAKAVLPIATDTLQSGLMKEVTGGNISGILGMFNSGSGLASNGLFDSLKGMLVQNIMTKMGLPPAIAGLVGDSGLESIIGGLAGKLSGGGGEVTQDSLMSNLGLGGGDAMDAVKNIAKGKLGDIAGGLFG